MRRPLAVDDFGAEASIGSSGTALPEIVAFTAFMGREVSRAGGMMTGRLWAGRLTIPFITSCKARTAPASDVP